MRTSIASATFLLLGASAAAAGAAYTGNGITIFGSDTLFQVSNDIMNECDGQIHNNGLPAAGNMHGDDKPYAGGGSGVGANAMALGQQELAPMSRALKNFEYCNNSPSYTIGTQSSTNGLIVGLDGVSIMANSAQACSGDLPNSGANSSFTFTSTVTGPTTYTIKNSLDALRLAFAGTDSASLSYEGDYGCGGPIRKALLSNWSALFAASCGAGSGKCDGSTDANGNSQPTGVSHLWRRSDLSGTTDAFVSLVNLGVRKVGNNPAVNPASFAYTINPFCNSIDANLAPPAATAAGTSCTSDANCPTLWGSKCVSGICSGTKTSDTGNVQNGHIAIPCLLTTTTTTRVVGGAAALPNPNNVNVDCQIVGDTFLDSNQNTIMQDSVCQQGPVLTGDGTLTGNTNDTVRTGFCHPGSLATLADYADSDPVRIFCDSDATNTDTESVCEKDGTLGTVLPVLLPDVPAGGTALTTTDQYPPVACDLNQPCQLSQTFAGDNGPCPRGGPRILGRCFQPVVKTNGVFNFDCVAPSAAHCFGDTGTDGRAYNLPVKRKNGSEGGHYVQDSTFAFMTGSFFRVHQAKASSYATATTGLNTCTQNSDTKQIGCLVTSDPCSTGFAGREADQVNSTFNKPLSVNTILPRLPLSATPDSTITQLIDGTEPTTHKKCATSADCTSPTVCNTQFGLCYPPGDVVYPLARRLFVASLVGMGALVGDEAQFALCYGDNNLLTPIIQNDNFVPVPGGASCIDYPENNSGIPEAIILNTCSGTTTVNGGPNTPACSGATAPIISNH